MKIAKHIVLILLACFLLEAKTVSAAFSPSACNVVVPIPNDVAGYLQGSTVYGYLQQLLKVQNCNDGQKQMTICVFNPANTSEDGCDLATLAVNNGGYLSQIFPHNPLFAEDISLKKVRISVAETGGKICLMMPTPYGLKPLTCKELPNRPNAPNTNNPPEEDESCPPASQACIGINASQSLFNFSGGAVQCVQETLSSIFFNPNQCGANAQSFMSSLKQFAVFQQALQKAVGALLILYVIGFGINILLEGGKVSLDSIVGFVVKFLLVAYFSVGLGPSYYNRSNGQIAIHNGMIDWGLPILTQATTDFAEMMFAAGGSRDLCSFDVTKYPPGLGGYAVWDVLDCKLGAYFGIKSVYNLGDILSNKNLTEVGTIPPSVQFIKLDSQFNTDDSWTSELGVFCVLFLLMIGGGFFIIIALFYYLLIFFGFVFGFISIFSICVITLYLLVYLSPIFVPMALFHRTKGYFDAWTKALVGCTLQPMVIGGFTAIIITLYDSLLYGTCRFVIHEYQSTYNLYYRAFEMVIPANDVAGCVSTPGYILLSYILGAGSAEDNYIFFKISYINDVYNLTGQSLILMVLSSVFYYFSVTLYQFAADLTGGIDASGVAISANKVVDKVRGAIKLAILVVRAVLRDPSAKKELEQKAKSEAQSAAPQGGGEEKGKDDGPKAPGEEKGKDDGPKAPGGGAPRGGVPDGVGK